MYIPRIIEQKIKSKLFKGKAIVIFGPRQSGKSTLLNKILSDLNQYKQLLLNGDDITIHSYFEKPSIETLRSIVGSNDIIAIDEAQRIPNIGLNIKILVDNFPGVQVIATGSSAFELSDKIQESLAGRKYEFFLTPFSYEELRGKFGFIKEHSNLENRLVFGSFPEVVLNRQEAPQYLLSLVNSVMYKDLFSIEKIRKPALLQKLLQALALQVGSEVSYNELSQIIQSDKETVEKYIDLLEKTFIVFRLPALSRNQRREIRRSRKIYFWDNGLRNAIIGNFIPLANRQDVGNLWENYLVSERKKLISNHQLLVNTYFWRTHQGSEIDYVEQTGDQYKGFEFKWNPKRAYTKPKSFIQSYNAHIELVTQDNYDTFLMRNIDKNEH